MKLLANLLLILFVSGSVYAQKPKVTEGSWSNLKGISEFNLVFDYEGLEVIDFDSEEAFLEEKMKDREEKEAGGGEKFKNSWLSDREERYEPDFILGFNKKYSDISTVSQDSDSEYTMKIKTRKIYPGYNVGVMNQPAKLYFTVIVYKTDSPSDVVFSADMDKTLSSSGYGASYNTGARIANAYYIGAQYFKKALKKYAK